jgi:hypothetical protein
VSQFGEERTALAASSDCLVSGMGRELVTESPDLLPVISASIYCHGFVDGLLREVILPLWKSTKTALPQSSLWVIRYARGGQHLKIRLHAPAEAHAAIATRLQDAVETFFAGLPAPAGVERDAAAYLPPIDPEDHADGVQPDRSLIWTRYRYLPELIGAEPLSAAAGFEAAFVRCRAASTEVMLDWLDALESVEIPMRKRMALALQLFLAAVCGVHPQAATRARYLTFQRDWLLRVSPDREQALALLERKVDALPAQQTTLGPLVTATPPQDGALGTWCHAMGDLVRFCLDQLERQDLSNLDGASEVLVYLAISRVVHNAMNPTAIGASNEAYLCHLLRSTLVRARTNGRSSGS